MILIGPNNMAPAHRIRNDIEERDKGRNYISFMDPGSGKIVSLTICVP